MQEVPPADIVAAFQAGLDHCEKTIPSSLVSKCFDNGLNPVSLPNMCSMEIFDDCGRRSLFEHKRSPSIGDIQSVGNKRSTLCHENKFSYNRNNSCLTSLQCSDVKLTNFEAENRQLSESAACNSITASLFVEPRTVTVDDDDDDVGWFFEDVSNANDDYDQQTVSDAFPVLSTVDKVANTGLESADKEHNTMRRTCGRLPSPEDVDGCTMQTLGTHDEGDSSANFGLHLSQSLVVGNSQSHCSVLDTDKCASKSGSAEHCREIVLNATTNESDNHKLLPSQQSMQAKGNESTSKPSQSDLIAVAEGLQFSVSLPVLDLRTVAGILSDGKVPTKLNSKVSSKQVLRNSHNIFSHSRHFRSIQNATRTAAGDLSDEAVCDNLHDDDLQSPSVLSSQVSQDINTVAQSSEIRQFSEHMTTGRMEKIGDREPCYFSRLEQIAMSLSHGDDEMMRLAAEICHRQLALNPTQTWLVCC